MGSHRSRHRWRRRLLLFAAVAILGLAGYVVARWLASSVGGFGPDVTGWRTVFREAGST